MWCITKKNQLRGLQGQLYFFRPKKLPLGEKSNKNTAQGLRTSVHSVGSNDHVGFLDFDIVNLELRVLQTAQNEDQWIYNVM